MNLGLLLLRTVVGITLAAHGAQKFGGFGGHGLEATAKGFEHLGFRPGRLYASAAGIGEIGAGLLLAMGLATPLAAALIVAVMLVAAVSAHGKGGFFLSSGGYEYNLLIATAAVTLAFSGPGLWSLDAWLGLPLSGSLWGATTIAVGLAGAVVPLAGRRRPDVSLT